MLIFRTDLTTVATALCEAYPKEDRSNELKTVAIAAIALMIPFLFLRLYTRWYKIGRLWPDDIFAIVASVNLFAMVVESFKLTPAVGHFTSLPSYCSAHVARRIWLSLLERINRERHCATQDVLRCSDALCPRTDLLQSLHPGPLL